MNWTFLTDAETEYEDAAVYYETACEGLGQRFLLEADDALRMAAEFPRSGTRVVDAPAGWEIRRRLLQTFPIEIDYMLHDGVIIVLAVFHASRKPGYWFDRLKSLQ